MSVRLADDYQLIASRLAEIEAERAEGFRRKVEEVTAITGEQDGVVWDD